MSRQTFRAILLLVTAPIAFANCSADDTGNSGGAARTNDETLAATTTEWRATVEARIGGSLLGDSAVSRGQTFDL